MVPHRLFVDVSHRPLDGREQHEGLSHASRAAPVPLLKSRVFKLQGLKEKLHLDELNPAIFRLLTLLQLGLRSPRRVLLVLHAYREAQRGRRRGGRRYRVAVSCARQSIGDMDEGPITWPLSFYFSPDRNSTLACGKFSEQYLLASIGRSRRARRGLRRHARHQRNRAIAQSLRSSSARLRSARSSAP